MKEALNGYSQMAIALNAAAFPAYQPHPLKIDVERWRPS